MENVKTVERLKKIILKGKYERETFLLDLRDFSEMNTISQETYENLLGMIPELKSDGYVIMDVESNYGNSDTTYVLLKKQITKQVYSESAIKQMVTDFRITSTITRAQFIDLKNHIVSIYNPIIENEEIEGEI